MKNENMPKKIEDNRLKDISGGWQRTRQSC